MYQHSTDNYNRTKTNNNNVASEHNHGHL